jgi:hypothetical protein
MCLKEDSAMTTGPHAPRAAIVRPPSDAFARAISSSGAAIDPARARAQHAAYRAALAELGAAYRRHLGRHYVATALFEVAGLFDPAAKVELVGTAVVPDPEPEEHP